MYTAWVMIAEDAITRTSHSMPLRGKWQGNMIQGMSLVSQKGRHRNRGDRLADLRGRGRGWGIYIHDIEGRGRAGRNAG